MGRAPCCEKEGLKKGKWTIEEDETLLRYIAENGEGSWKSLPKNAGLQRCGKSCRLRWKNYLRADLKRGNISKEEEEIIIMLHSTLGNRWSIIAAQLPGRTDNEIKNYWNSHLRRRIHSFRRNSDGGTVIVDVGTVGKRRGCSTSRELVKKTPLPSVTDAIRKDSNQAQASSSIRTIASYASEQSEKASSSSNISSNFSLDLDSIGEVLGPDVEDGAAATEEITGAPAIRAEGEDVVMEWDFERLEATLLEDETRLWDFSGQGCFYDQSPLSSWLLS